MTDQFIKGLFVPVIGFFLITGCKQTSGPVQTVHESNLEAREDSMELARAYVSQSLIRHVVYPDVETDAVNAASADDAADDPAIWVHPTSPDSSVVFGTNKKGGLLAYDLNGRELHYYRLGRINNADVIQHVQIGNRHVDLLTCTNRTDQSLELFEIKSGQLADESRVKHKVDTAEMDDVYGICFAHFDHDIFIFMNAKNGRVQQYQIQEKERGLTVELVRQFDFGKQTEGMVADNENRILYVGVEDEGIWKMPFHSDPVFLEESSEKNNPNIRFDLEGLATMEIEGEKYLVASSQGNFSFAVFKMGSPDKYLGSFKIMGQNGIDGVEETDGLEIVTDSLNPQFNRGILIVQDGFNYDGEKVVAQNFKYVDLKKVLVLDFMN